MGVPDVISTADEVLLAAMAVLLAHGARRAWGMWARVVCMGVGLALILLSSLAMTGVTGHVH